jgi:hypothetical protein
MENTDHLRRAVAANAIANEYWSRSERVDRVQAEASQCEVAACDWLGRQVSDEELIERIIGNVIVSLGALDQFDAEKVLNGWDLVLARFDGAIAEKGGQR